MEGFLGLLLIVAIIGVFIWSCNPDNAVWGQNPSKQRRELEKHYDRLNCTVTPRYHPDELALHHPEATVVINASMRLGNDWHVILHPWDQRDWDPDAPDAEDRMLALLYEKDWFLACTGQAMRPDGFTPLLAAFFNLEHTISCPYCLAAMTRIYIINKQPGYPRELYRSQAQLMVSPELLGWDTARLRPPRTRKQKAKPDNRIKGKGGVVT